MELFPEADGAGPGAVRQVTLVRLSAEIARSLTAVGRVAVEGEVHRPTRGASGRVWFTLRDRTCQIHVTCPASRARRCRAVAGERVCVTGQLGYVNDRGDVQLVADEVTPVGAGAIAALVAESRQRLGAEGLLDRPRRPVPRLPAVIGVVCGSEAAVRADIESVVAARFPGYPVDFMEVNVSGPGAADAVARAVAVLDGRPHIDVIVLARGGGDAAQLLPFSDEDLCRAVAASTTPVVSAIGHEGDRPLCDEVADLRCGTPSLAAAAVVPSLAELLAELDRLRPEPAAEAGLAAAGERLARVGARLDGLHPGRRADDAAARLRALDWRSPGRVRLARAGERLSGLRHQLDALDPVRVLERGYAVVRDTDGRVIRDPDAVAAGQRLAVQVARGRFGVDVIEPADG